jgi:hypothetical protein
MMPRYDALENHPLQLFSYEDLQAILDEMLNNFPQEWHTKVAEKEWRKLADMVRKALEEAYLRGPAAKDVWLPRIAAEWTRIEGKRSVRVVTEVRIGYLRLVDRLYGAIYRHVLRRVPTSVHSRAGVFHLSRLLYYRYARVRDTDKPALQELMELLYEGSGLKIELEFSWKPIGDGLGDDASWRRRMNE